MTHRRGFTLVELLIYVAIFSAIAGTFISVLIIMVSIQARQSTLGEAQQQGQFLEQQIQYYVESARLVDMVRDASSTTLTLREPLASSSADPTTFTLSSGVVYLTQGIGGTPQALTSNRVTVSGLSFTRHFNLNSTSSAYGTDSVSFSFTVTSVAGQKTFTQSFQSSANVFAPVPKIALIQQAKVQNNSGTSTSITAPYAMANEKGDLLLAVVANQHLVTSTVSDGAGNTWALVASSSYAAYGNEVWIYAALNATTSVSNGVTVNFGGTGAYDPSLYIYEYRGASTSSSLDAWGAQNNANTTTSTSPTVWPGSNAELLLGVDSNGAPATAAGTAGSGFTLETSPTTGYATQLFVEDMDQYITGGVSAPWSFNMSVSSTNLIATFQ